MGNPIYFANIALLQLPDSTLIGGTTTDDSGAFHLTISNVAQPAILRISFIGYVTENIVPQKEKTMQISLVPDAAMLGEVIVTAKSHRPIVEMKNGNIVFNVQNNASAQGGNALDILRKTPGLFVDGQNNISMGGRVGVLVIVNGKQTYMQKSELTSLLRSTPASSIAKVEVMNNPSSQFDAEGSAGIVNIVLKSDKRSGYYINVNNGLVYGERWRDYGDVSVNVNAGKLNFYTSYSQALGSLNYHYGNTRLQSDNRISSRSNDTDKRQTVTGMLGADYRFSEKHTLGAALNGNFLFGPGAIWTNIDVRDAKTDALQRSIYSVSDYYRQKENYIGGNLHYRFTPDENRVFWFDADIARFDGGSGILQSNTNILPSGEETNGKINRILHNRDIQIVAFSANDELPLMGGTLTSGAKYSLVNAENKFDFYAGIPAAETLDADMSNTFVYQEQIIAAYAMYKRGITEKISFDGGLRAEYTLSRGVLTPHTGSKNKPETNPNDYFNLFPSVGFNIEFGEAHSLSLHYSRRIGRPAYQSLNPFEQPLDELSAWKGNPFLKPQTTNRVSVNYALKKTVFGVSYSWAKDFSAQITDTLGLQRVVQVPKNIGRQKVFNLNVLQQIRATQWWRLSFNGNLYHQQNKLSLGNNRNPFIEGWAGGISVQNNFDLPFDISAELSGTYNSRRLGASYETPKSTHSVDLALKRNFLKDKCSVGLVFTDIFHGNRWDNYGGFEGFHIENYGHWDSRQIKLNISFRFGSSSEKKEAHQNDLEERGRL